MLSLYKKRAAPQKSRPPLAVIVADDVKEIQALVTTWLEEAGHSVIAAQNGCEIIRLVKERPFDLVVTDIVMPDGDGWDAILAVNRLRPATRILAISGGGRQMPADACLRVAKGVGADGVLRKPFRRGQFLAAVEQVMDR